METLIVRAQHLSEFVPYFSDRSLHYDQATLYKKPSRVKGEDVMTGFSRFFCFMFLCGFFIANPKLAAGNVCPTGGESHPTEFTFCPTHGVKLIAEPESTPKNHASKASPEPACKVNDPDIGQSYEGECANGLANGQGTASGRDKYVGSFRNGNKSGSGVYTWASGDKYDGIYLDDKRFFSGTFTWASGDKYIGAWEEGQRTGFGVYLGANGDKYAGGFKDGKRNGYGIQLSADDIKNKIPLRSRFAMWDNDKESLIDLDHNDSYDYDAYSSNSGLFYALKQDDFDRCRKALEK